MNVEVAAVLQADPSTFGTATVTVLAPLEISPKVAAITTWQTVQFTAAGAAGAGVDWSVEPGGASVSDSGLFRPSGAGVFAITAKSKSNPSISASATAYVTDFAGTLSWRNDAGLTGQNAQELALNPATVQPGRFGKLGSCAVDGPIYAQPLYVANISNGRNAVYVATENDTVYAFDADAIPCVTIWQRNFASGEAGASPVPTGDPEVNNREISGVMGITGTPAIDRQSGTIYFVAMTKEEGTAGSVYVHRLYALDLLSGAERPHSHQPIQASVPGTGQGNDGSDHVVLDGSDAGLHYQRGALELLGGKLYIPFTGNDPADPAGGFHGWLLVYDPASLAQIDAFNTTPDSSRGGIGSAASSDQSGKLYVAAGQGAFGTGPAPSLRNNFGQTLLKLQPPPPSIGNSAADTFTPFNQQQLTFLQRDFGATGVVILPDSAGSAATPHLAVTGGYDSGTPGGVLYLLNRDNLGGYNGPGGPDRVIGKVAFGGPILGTPAFWQNTLFIAAAGDALKAFGVQNGVISGVQSQTAGFFNLFGAAPVVSSHGAAGGIVWAVDSSGAGANPPGPAVLHAYDAGNLARELYNSGAEPGDAAGAAVKLAVPTVANGKVYLGSQNELTIYGLLP